MLEIGAIVEGKVASVTSFGAFVNLPDGKSGMVHISEVSDSFVKDINEFLKEGDSVKVKVIGINEAGKISLSIRKARPQQEKPQPCPRQQRSDRPRPNVWQGQAKPKKEAMSFEDMMAQFKQVSDEKMTDLKHAGDNGRRGSRRGSRNN